MLLGTYKKAFEILDEGVYSAVLAAVQDLGDVTSKFDGTTKPKVRFVFLTDELDSKGNRHQQFWSVVNTLHEKGNLAKIIKGLTGKLPSADEPIEPDTLIGKQCQVTISHKESDGVTYANITQVLKPAKGQHVEIPDDWEPPKVKQQLLPTAKNNGQHGVPKAEIPTEIPSGDKLFEADANAESD
jgi:hypothetical protein